MTANHALQILKKFSICRAANLTHKEAEKIADYKIDPYVYESIVPYNKKTSGW